MKVLWLAPLLAVTASCTSSPADPKLDPQYIYKMDMSLLVNNKMSNGTIVVPRAPKYTIKIKAAGRLDLFTFTNCHREMAQTVDGQEITFEYTPTPGVEDGICPIQLGGYEKERGRHSWGFIDFENPGYTKVATIKCNGSVTVSGGVSVCQSLNGLIQEIEFSSPVLVSPDEQCPLAPSKDGGKTWQFPIVKGQCVYIFLDKDKNSNAMHRLTTIGYEKILFRDK